MAFTLSISDKLTPNYTKTTGISGGAALTYAPSLITAISVATGTASGQADLLYAGTRTLVASTTEDLDLAGTFLQDVFGANLTFVKVKGVWVKAAAANTNNVVIGGAAATQFLGWFNAATDKYILWPGMPFIAVHPTVGWTVTPGTNDLLRMGNSGAGTSVVYDILIWGTSA